MRKSILAITGLFLCMMMYAQTPQGITHQAVIRDAQGQLVTNATIGIKVSIIKGTFGGTAVYVETHNPESNAHGLVTYVIGEGTFDSGNFENIDWADGPYFLKTEVDPAGGTSYTIEGTTQFHWVPYALYAKVAGDLSGGIVDLLEARIGKIENILFLSPSGTFTDERDGSTYKWIRIGDQVWMAENLNYATANSWCYDNNDTNCDHYGRLYTWNAAMAGSASSSTSPSGVQGGCPEGWHVPSDAEWTELVNYVVSLGYPNSNVVGGAGNALKSCWQVGSPLNGCDTSDHPRWDSHGTHNGTDLFGFSALPGGYRSPGGSFFGRGQAGYWWSATETSTTDAFSKSIHYDYGAGISLTNDKASGFSLRCVRD